VLSNFGTGDVEGAVIKLRASDGANLGTFSTGGQGTTAVAFDGANMWIANNAQVFGFNTVSKL